ncbi:hypothetical protein BIV57_00035 [Mangrovactinospora gilvigrisea]|uniref:DUF1707 domain-containing protein n=1 Tax=Mangrovactinospora gilvigrisea TaxID=1428644 RepID=A0A1J7BLG2_9ACTN|nr:DUF1707 domain-containing protein [Mangrovactinospora gilvigrisea]OIV39539.1 hypothetical protein BIV57_00035 [Mangrovactinospora gilvigrisea]
MSAEISPTGKDSGAELRASHADRDQVVERLRVAAGDGLIGAEELDERVEAALKARTRGELAPLTADLPAAAGAVEAKDTVRIQQAHSGRIERTGRWVLPRRMELEIAWCAVTLDLTEAVITNDVLELDVKMAGKTLTLITGPGMAVDTDELQLVHCKLDDRRAPDDPGTPVTLRVRLVGQKAHGRVVFRSRRPGRLARRARRSVRA